MNNKPGDLADKLIEEGARLVEFFASLPASAWHTLVYTDGAEWQVRQVFAHLTQAEASMYRLFLNVIARRGGVPEDFDLDGYNQRKVGEIAEPDRNKLIALFQTRREKTAAWVRERSPEELEIQGRHPFLGVVPLLDMIKLLYMHGKLHQRDITKRLQEAG
jgi:hypothetical protein